MSTCLAMKSGVASSRPRLEFMSAPAASSAVAPASNPYVRQSDSYKTVCCPYKTVMYKTVMRRLSHMGQPCDEERGRVVAPTSNPCGPLSSERLSFDCLISHMAVLHGIYKTVMTNSYGTYRTVARWRLQSSAPRVPISARSQQRRRPRLEPLRPAVE